MFSNFNIKTPRTLAALEPFDLLIVNILINILLLKWMLFPERVIYMKLLKCLKLLGEMRLNILDRFLLLRLIYMLLRSSSNFQLYTPKPHLEIYRNTFVF